MEQIIVNDFFDYLNSIGYDYESNADPNEVICGFSSINNYRKGTFTWVKKQENASIIPNDVTLVITEKNIKLVNKQFIKVDNSKKIFFELIDHFFSTVYQPPKLGKGTFIGKDVKLGNNVKIGHNCSIDGNIFIDDDTTIFNNVSIIGKVNIGKKCVIQSGVLIGDEGYSYTEDSYHKKTMNRQFGGVTIGNDVLIGAGTIVQNGAIDDTSIGDGCKISGASFISHNVNLGDNVAVIVSTMHGSSAAKNNAYIVSSTVRNQKTIGENTLVGLGSVVVNDIGDNLVVTGYPAKPFNK